MFFSLKTREEKRSSSERSHDITHSITMIHCVARASALWERRPISFIWHFIAVRSQRLRATLEGGHSLIVRWGRDGGWAGWTGGREDGWREGWGGERGDPHCRGKVRVCEGGMGENETTMAKASAGFQPPTPTPTPGRPAFHVPHEDFHRISPRQTRNYCVTVTQNGFIRCQGPASLLKEIRCCLPCCGSFPAVSSRRRGQDA